MTSRTLLVTACLLLTPVVVSGQDGERVDALIGLARVKRDAGDPGEAARLFEAAQKVRALEDSELAEYFWCLADTDADRAGAVGARVLAARPWDRDVRARAIALAVAREDEAAVRALASAGEQASPGVSLWPRRLGESYLRDGQPAVAREAFARAVRAADAADPDWAGYAVALEATGDAQSSLDAWSRVQPDVRSGRIDWGTSFLRALAGAAPPADAAAAIRVWLDAHPDDHETRGLLVETWSRAGEPEKALDALGPLPSGPARAHWLRREAELAHEAGDRARAIRAYEQLARMGRADTTALWTLATLMVEEKMFDRAGGVVEKAAASATCDDRSLELYDRFPDPDAADLLLNTIARRPRQCLAPASWTARAALRAVALGRAARALEVVGREVARGQQGPETQAIHGQLLLWTGQPRLAVDALEAVVSEHPSPEVVDALADAYRATGHPRRAWSLVASRLEDGTTGDRRRLELAALAVEADHADRALEAARSLGDREPVAARLIAGRALAALGRPSEALEVLREDEEAVRRSPEATLALADAVAAMHGTERALETVRSIRPGEVGWIEVEARRAVWEAVVGDRQVARHVRDGVARMDPRRAVMVDAEIALAEHQPAAALEALAPVLVGNPDERAADLQSVALAGTGSYGQALEVLRQLRAARPLFVPFLLREAEWSWRAARTPDTLSAMLDVASAHPERDDARIAAARVLCDDRQYERALDVLGPPEGAGTRRSIDRRLVEARALRALGRHADALDIVADGSIADERVALLRAELTSAVDGAAAADPLFEALASSDRSGPGVFMAWSTVQPSPAARQAVLTRAVGRFPNSVDALAALASAAASARDWPAALAAANRAIALEARQDDAWIARIDAAVHLHSSDLDRTLDQFSELFGDDPFLVIGMAERIAQLSRSAHDPLVVRAMSWLDGLDPVVQRNESAQLARARVLAASEQWTKALETVGEARQDHPGSLQAHRLQADLLAFSGRYREALATYDDYLARAPLDVDAARLRARVLGWAGQVDAARAQYFALVREHPDAAALAAEAVAKDEFLRERWREAVPAYERWLLIEPDSREAAFELAQSRAALGEVAAAARLLRDLDTELPVHRLARAASDRLEAARRPSVDAYGSVRRSDGYDGLRLLELSEQGGTFTSRLGASLPAEVGVAGGSVAASAGGSERNGYRATAFGGYRLSRAWSMKGRVGLLDFSQGARPSVEGRATVEWRPVDEWAFFGGADRSAILENLFTVDARLSATGGVAGMRFDSPTTGLQVSGGRYALSDGNGVSSATLTASRRLTRGTHDIRVVGWGWYVSYDEPRADYFSRVSFVRADAGLEWTWWFERPRFRGDRERRLAVGYLFGTDSDGVLYHHPSARLLFELPAGIAIEAGADWIRSDVYRETNARVGLRLGPAPRRD